MTPEESVKAGIDVKASAILPIHWGAFKLANHTWIDPVEHFVKESEALKVNYATPSIGESIELTSENYTKTKWWKNF